MSITFTQDHKKDLEILKSAILDNEILYFSRFADGERSTIEGRNCRADGWIANKNGKNRQLSDIMSKAISYTHNNYYIGFSCPCCDAPSNRFYKQRIKLNLENLTYSTIFANGNVNIAEVFLKELIKSTDLDIVGCKDESTIKISENMIEPLVDSSICLDQMANSSKNIILLAAGPYSCILMYEYLLRQMPPKTIIDIGSALDGIYGRKTRRYHTDGHKNRIKICRNLLK